MPLSDRLAVLPQYLFPKQALTQFAGWVARDQGGARTTALIEWFIRRYHVNMAEAADANPAAYPSFNAFFTRALKDGVRPLAPTEFVCPVDGAVSQVGAITGSSGDQIFQAKGHHYSTTALVGGDPALAAQFKGGSFATIYLSPRDYHRIHMPCDGRLLRMIYVPGALFSVNPTTARGVPGLFARNERVVCEFESAHGRFVLVLVGATIVGSMTTVWHGLVNGVRSGQLQQTTYSDRHIALAQGQEMGRFLLGSTVVLLFPAGAIQWERSWVAEKAVRLGEAMGRR